MRGRNELVMKRGANNKAPSTDGKDARTLVSLHIRVDCLICMLVCMFVSLRFRETFAISFAGVGQGVWGLLFTTGGQGVLGLLFTTGWMDGGFLLGGWGFMIHTWSLSRSPAKSASATKNASMARSPPNPVCNR